MITEAHLTWNVAGLDGGGKAVMCITPRHCSEKVLWIGASHKQNVDIIFTRYCMNTNKYKATLICVSKCPFRTQPMCCVSRANIFVARASILGHWKEARVWCCVLYLQDTTRKTLQQVFILGHRCAARLSVTWAAPIPLTFTSGARVAHIINAMSMPRWAMPCQCHIINMSKDQCHVSMPALAPPFSVQHLFASKFPSWNRTRYFRCIAWTYLSDTHFTNCST